MTAGSDPVAAAAHGGDRKAFEALMTREKASLYAFVRRSARNPDDAYDLMQETFVTAWRSIRRYDPNRSFGVWLRAIALNKCRDLARRNKVRISVLSLLGSEPQAAPYDETVDARLAQLDAAIATLPRDQREPLLLTTAGGLSHEEAAQLLKTSAKAIEMKLYRARRRLRELLAPSEG